METQVTLTIPDEVYRRAKELARARNRPVAEVLAESIVLDEELETEGMAAVEDDGMAALEAAAERSNVYDVAPFVAVSEQMDWRERPAAAFVRGVRLALKLERI
jgi:predicted transcriptional regulator